jgi:hypothetical protein
MLWTIFVILVVLWLLGVIGSVAGRLIHRLPGAAPLLFICHLLSGHQTLI